MKRAFAWAFFALLVLVSGFSTAQDAALLDRIVAVVDDDPILESDLDRVIGLGLVQRQDDESERAFRRRALDRLVEEALRFHEIDRFGFSEIQLEDVELAYREIESRYENEDEFLRVLEALSMTPEELRQLVARQLMVLTYVDERLGPRVFVSSDDIEAYYVDTLVPELESRQASVPDLDEVREQIREVVKQQRLDEELERWTEELRQEADIEDYFDEIASELPPEILRRSDE
jgi:peptidyl-prolyl cis-trans isomerase SurA